MSAGRFGRYEVLRPLGEGGFGEVWLARDPILGREVAVKVARAGWGGDEELLREARALARLRHPGIVQVLDAVLEEGRVHVVLELMAGPSLEDLLGGPGAARPATLPPAAALQLLEGPAEALDHAHAQGFLHRDLKPGNLLLEQAVGPAGSLLERIAAAGTPKIADFGLAALVARHGSSATEAGAGDPLYAAPEAWRGQPDTSSDVFSLAAVFFRLVAGRPPLPGTTPAELLAAAGRPERLRLDEAASGLPRPLAGALDCALSARRHERPATAADLVLLLESALARNEEKERVVREALDRIALRRSPAVAACEGCGKTVATGARLCPHCGKRKT